MGVKSGFLQSRSHVGRDLGFSIKVGIIPTKLGWLDSLLIVDYCLLFVPQYSAADKKCAFKIKNDFKALLRKAIYFKELTMQCECKASCIENSVDNIPLCNWLRNKKLQSKLQKKLNNLLLFAALRCNMYWATCFATLACHICLKCEKPRCILFYRR